MYIQKAFSWLPLSGVTPHSVGRCYEVTEGTATVSGCLRSRLRGSQKSFIKAFSLPPSFATQNPPPSSEGGGFKFIDTLKRAFELIRRYQYNSIPLRFNKSWIPSGDSANSLTLTPNFKKSLASERVKKELSVVPSSKGNSQLT